MIDSGNFVFVAVDSWTSSRLWLCNLSLISKDVSPSNIWFC